ncbi:MAG: cytochrome C [Candidatus Thiodiazotropha sp. (ex Epidulcina cf. delphinae)]|nr:cytochrome C [Candidatus Thiodiazotropha sp. (ex Epidulcina cf. delphinae)]
MLDALKAIIRTVYIFALMGFTLWFGYFLHPVIFGMDGAETEEDIATREIGAFFGEGATEEEKEFMKSIKQQQQTSTTDLGYMVIEEQYVKGHFHHVGMKVESDSSSICTGCHGAVPHDKAKTIRAFLNMHAFYMACETCHVRPEGNEPRYEFRWYDKETGKVVANPPGLNTLDESMYGNYAAKISPGELRRDGTFKFLNGPKELAFVERYLKEESRLNDTQKSKMKKVIHRNVNEDPLICDGCHTIVDEPYLPYTLLGYPQRRLHELTSTEVVGMINKYKEFYIPHLLRGGGVDKDVEAE